jgi:small-conductance mechanosensitive channel
MISEWIRDLNNVIGVDSQIRLVVSVIFVIFVTMVYHYTMKKLHNKMVDMEKYYNFKKRSGNLLATFTILILAMLWVNEFKNLSTFLGLFSAGLAISLKDIISNMAGWLFIIWRKPFIVGDRIQIGTTSGDVVDTRLFHFTVMEIGNWVENDQSTGRIIHVPNNKIITDPLANYGQGFQYIWNEISVLMTFESDWKKAKKILLKIAEKHAEHLSAEAEQKVRMAARKYMIIYNYLTPIVYVSVKDSGIQLTMRYLCEPRKRRTTIDEIWEDILQEFSMYKDLKFAYNTQRVIIDDK